MTLIHDMPDHAVLVAIDVAKRLRRFSQCRAAAWLALGSVRIDLNADSHGPGLQRALH
jgi:hypothetical protein